MNYCAICGTTPVEGNGFVCQSCADNMDPFALAAAGYQISTSNAEDAGTSVIPPVKKRVLLDKQPEEQKTYSTNRTLLDDAATGAVEDGTSKLSAAISETLAAAAAQPSPLPSVTSPTGAITNNGSSTAIKATPFNNNAGSNASSGSMEHISGIAKNVIQDVDRRGVIWRWFRSVGTGSSFSVDSDITEFQVFPDFSGTTLTASGTSSDQVIMYGKIRTGMISENNDVEVYGRRDKSNTIIASKIKNVATGAVAKPSLVMSATMTRVITLLLVMLVGLILFLWGPGFFINLALLIVFILLLPFIVKFFAWLLTLMIMKA